MTLLGGVGAVFWTASGKVLDGVQQGARRRRGRFPTPSSEPPDAVQIPWIPPPCCPFCCACLVCERALAFLCACLVSVRLDSTQPRLHVAHRAISASLRPLDIHKYVFGSKSCRTRRDARRPFGWRRRIKPRMALSSAFGLVGGSRVARYRDFVRRLPRHSRRYASPGVVASRRGVRYAWRRS